VQKIIPPVVVDPNQRYGILEASAILRQCKAKTYQDISEGRLRVFKDGRRTYVSGAVLLERSRPPVEECAA
jgi:hypothetical protein